jgi:hypothetical protein
MEFDKPHRAEMKNKDKQVQLRDYFPDITNFKCFASLLMEATSISSRAALLHTTITFRSFKIAQSNRMVRESIAFG